MSYLRFFDEFYGVFVHHGHRPNDDSIGFFENGNVHGLEKCFFVVFFARRFLSDLKREKESKKGDKILLRETRRSSSSFRVINCFFEIRFFAPTAKQLKTPFQKFEFHKTFY